jgi:ADP-heptose:LPS heptosyltransferase
VTAPRILVIKLGALGDVVLAFAPFAAIRDAHPDAGITLLTTKPFAGLALASPWFDRVAIDARPALWNLRGLRRLRAQLAGYDFVYDLQTSGRSSRYHLLAGRPPWSGIARGCSHPHADPRRDLIHTRLRQTGQLADAGIPDVPWPDLGWLQALGRQRLERELRPDERPSGPYALLVPGAAPHRPAKRWPAPRFGAVARMLAERGVQPVVLGTAAEAPLAAEVVAAAPSARDLTGRTSLPALAALAGAARLAIGNDTGPMHLAAAMGAATLTLFSGDSDPALTAPMGPGPGRAEVLQAPHLADLPVDAVVARVAALLG